MKYDAVIIGAGADGLGAAATLARAGLAVAVVERRDKAGGRCETREFHPGYRASPYADDLPAIPSDIFRSLDLARLGALPLPSHPPALLSQGAIAPCGAGYRGLWESAATLTRSARLLEESPPKRTLLPRRAPSPPWPGEDWSYRSLCDVVGEKLPDGEDGSLALAEALMGRAVDPRLGGSALNLLGAGPRFAARGGLGALAVALEAAARAAGATLMCGREVSEVTLRRGRAVGVGFADGGTLAARAVISTLDAKRSFLSLFAWSALPKSLVADAGAYRMAGATARLLVALRASPRQRLPSGTIHLAPSAQSLADAALAWRSGAVPARPSIALRFVSATDPSLAPDGGAVLTATIGAVPAKPYDGDWNAEKRERLRNTLLIVIEQAIPGIAARTLASELILPGDIEEELGLSGGDLMGGEMAADQMFGLRPFAGCAFGRTPVKAYYLAGPSSAAAPFGTCVAGLVAARALLADRKGWS